MSPRPTDRLCTRRPFTRRLFAAFVTCALTAGVLGATAATAQAPAAALSDKEMKKLARDTAAMAEAQKKYAATCAACHGPQGAGLIGPNLTDNFYLKGSSAQAIAESISKGSPQKGMPAMAPLLGQVGVKLMTAYVMTMKGKNLPGKPPEGKEEK